MTAQYPPMDSLTHVVFGGAVAVAAMRHRTPAWKAAVVGAVVNTLPDLDVFFDHGDVIGAMVLHRGWTHAPFWQSLLSLPIALAVARLAGEWAQWRRWWLTVWLCLVTHPLLDAMTVYGTQIALPFTHHPYGLGSIFIIDPLFTLPIVVGVVWALAARGSPRGLRANAIGLLLAAAYVAWGAGAQRHVAQIAQRSLAAQGIAVAADGLLVTPGPLNSVLWRVVAVPAAGGPHFYEGFYSLLDPEPRITFDRFDKGAALEGPLAGNSGVSRIAAFSKGFYKLQRQGDRAAIVDLRMGQEPAYSFHFVVARQGADGNWAPMVPANAGGRGDVQRGLAWVWRRMWGEVVPPPR